MHHHVIYHHSSQLGQDSVICILLATGWMVQGSNHGGGTTCYTPIETSPGAHPDTYTKGTGLFPGVKQLGHDVNHPPPSSAEVKKRVRLLCAS